jgi:hypothetical protein
MHRLPSVSKGNVSAVASWDEEQWIGLCSYSYENTLTQCERVAPR